MRWMLLLLLSPAAFGQVKFSWDPITTAIDGTDLTGVGVSYKLYVRTEEEARWTEQIRVNQTRYIYNPPRDGCYRARAVAVRLDSSVASDPSNWVSFCVGAAYEGSKPVAPVLRRDDF